MNNAVTSEVIDSTAPQSVEDIWDLSDEELEARVAAIRSGADTGTTIETDASSGSEVQTDDSTVEYESSEEALEQPVTDSVEQENVKTENVDDVVAQSAETEVVAVSKRKYKANGQEFEFSDEEVFNRFGQVFGQAMDYTKKMQAMAPYRTMISAIEEAKLTKDDLNLAIDVLKGDKKALAAIIKRSGVDTLELEGEEVEGWRPNSYGRSDTELNIQEVVSTISADPEYATTMGIINNGWDNKSVQVFVERPELIRELHLDVKNGVYAKVGPMAAALKVFDGGRKSDFDYYMEAGRKYYADLRDADMQSKVQENARRAGEVAAQEAMRIENEKKAKLRADEAKREQDMQMHAKRKAAAPNPAGRAGNKVIDYLDASDQDFDEWYNRVTNK